MRNSALALWLVAGGCGSDGGSDGPEPGDDAATPTDSGGATNDAGWPQDSGAPDSSIADAGGGDSGTPDGGSSDAGSAELAEALKTDGIRVDMTRAQLVIGAVCHRYALCEPADVNEQECISEGMAEWADPSIYQASEDAPCNDAKLDYGSCISAAACDQQSTCASFESATATLCPDDDAGT